MRLYYYHSQEQDDCREIQGTALGAMEGNITTRPKYGRDRSLGLTGLRKQHKTSIFLKQAMKNFKIIQSLNWKWSQTNCIEHNTPRYWYSVNVQSRDWQGHSVATAVQLNPLKPCGCISFTFKFAVRTSPNQVFVSSSEVICTWEDKSSNLVTWDSYKSVTSVFVFHFIIHNTIQGTTYVLKTASLNSRGINKPAHKPSVHIVLQPLQQHYVVYLITDISSLLFMQGRTYRRDEDHFLDSEHEDIVFLWNVNNYLKTEMASHPRRIWPTSAPLRECQTTQLLTYSLFIDAVNVSACAASNGRLIGA
jgi:hypothetical protein